MTETKTHPNINQNILDLEAKVEHLQQNPSNYPQPPEEELEQRIKIIPLERGKGHFWSMDIKLMQELYPTGWLHKAKICQSATLGKSQYVFVLGAQTAERDILAPARWMFEQLDQGQKLTMKNNLHLHCIDVLGPPSSADIWKEVQSGRSDLNVDFAQGLYETKTIESLLANLDLDQLKNRTMHIIAEGSTDYLSEETLITLLNLIAGNRIASCTLRTIIPIARDQIARDQFITPKASEIINASLNRDLGLKIGNPTTTGSKDPLPARTIQEVVQRAWKMNYSREELRKKGLDPSYPGIHLRPQDLVSTFRAIGKQVRFNLFFNNRRLSKRSIHCYLKLKNILATQEVLLCA